MGEAFRAGGWGMFPTVIFGLSMVAASVKYAMAPERRFVPLQLSLGVLTLASGGLGFVMGLIKSFSAMGDVGPDKKWLWMLGTGESLHDIALALGLCSLAGVAASIGALRIAGGAHGSAA